MTRHSGNTTVNEIAKRDVIFAYAKKDIVIGDLKFIEGDQIECSGHWTTNGKPYVSLMFVNSKIYTDASDFELDPELWNIFVLVRFTKE